MGTRAKPDITTLRASLAPVMEWLTGSADSDKAVIAAAVRTSARYLAAIAPGGAVELRVPPYVAVQCVEGLTHKRGTPPNVIEMDPRSWLDLVTGRASWADSLDRGFISVSGQRADLSAYLPLID